MSDDDLYQNSLSRLERLLSNPNGFGEEDLMNKLSWVEKRLKDKRKRPAAAKQAIAWLKARGNLWDVYQTEYAQPKQKPGAALAALRPKTDKPCGQCGKTFSGYSHQRYCSSTCRSNARHQRNRETKNKPD